MRPFVVGELLVPKIEAVRHQRSPWRAILVGLTGIDGCGKGYVAAELSRQLEERGHHVAGINVDGWLNLPGKRFSDRNPADHFYRHAIRFDDMFRDLVLPLRERGSVRLEAQFTEETATAYRPHLYAFDNIDVVVLEGIYLLKRAFQSFYDLSIWIDCSFETALERAVARAQEGLSPEATMTAYRTIYFPAQAIHLERDAPHEAATLVVKNDPRLA